MRMTLNIDDDLVAEARRITGVEDTAALVNEGLRALIERESTRRLASRSCAPSVGAAGRRASRPGRSQASNLSCHTINSMYTK